MMNSVARWMILALYGLLYAAFGGATALGQLEPVMQGSSYVVGSSPLPANWKQPPPEMADTSEFFTPQTNAVNVRDSVVAADYLSPRSSVLTLFAGLEGSKQPQDFGVNANFGGRVAINYGRMIDDSRGLGFQLGTSLNATGNAVQVFERIDGTEDRLQSFSTVAVFQRLAGWKYAIGYDFLYQDSYDHFFLGQWRGRLGIDLTQRDEFGVQFSLRDRGDSGFYANIPVSLRAMDQIALTWRRRWEADIRTGAWIGVSSSHGEVNLALGDLPDSGRQLLFGSDLFVPLNDHLAIYGEANLIMPADTGTVDAFLGLEFSPGGRMRQLRYSRSMPLLPVANNTSFAVDLNRN